MLSKTKIIIILTLVNFSLFSEIASAYEIETRSFGGIMSGSTNKIEVDTRGGYGLSHQPAGGLPALFDSFKPKPDVKTEPKKITENNGPGGTKPSSSPYSTSILNLPEQPPKEEIKKEITEKPKKETGEPIIEINKEIEKLITPEVKNPENKSAQIEEKKSLETPELKSITPEIKDQEVINLKGESTIKEEMQYLLLSFLDKFQNTIQNITYLFEKTIETENLHSAAEKTIKGNQSVLNGSTLSESTLNKSISNEPTPIQLKQKNKILACDILWILILIVISIILILILTIYSLIHNKNEKRK